MHRSYFFVPMFVSVVAALTVALLTAPAASAGSVHSAAPVGSVQGVTSAGSIQGVAAAGAAAGQAATGTAAAAGAAAAPTAGTFARLTPARLLDTRIRWGATGPVGALGSVALHVLGVSGVPATNVAAVALTVTATRSAGSGYLTVYADGAARPNASNLNFVPGRDVANMVIVPVGANGNIRLFNGAGSKVDMIADVAGYFIGGTPSAAGSFRALTVKRLLDTRWGPAAGALGSGATLAVPVTGAGGVPAGGVASVVVNLTATHSAEYGYLTAYPTGAVRPLTSTVNFAAGQNVANLAVVPVGADGRISVFNAGGASVDVLVDVLGYYLAGAPTVLGAFRSVTQQRVLDTRSGLGGSGLLIGDTTMPLRVMGSAGLPASGVSAVVLNLTVATPTAAGYLTAYPDNTALPNTSNLNFGTRLTTAALVTVPVGADGYLRLYNGGGATYVVADVVGYYIGNNPRPCNLVPADPSGTSVTRWNPVVLCVLGMLGAAQSASNVSDVDIVILYESSGDPNAVNLWDSNAQAGHPSKGLVQVIQPTFDYYRSLSLPSNLYDPAANIYAGMHYAISTYGSIHDIPGLVSLRNGGGYQGYIITK